MYRKKCMYVQGDSGGRVPWLGWLWFLIIHHLALLTSTFYQTLIWPCRIRPTVEQPNQNSQPNQGTRGDGSPCIFLDTNAFSSQVMKICPVWDCSRFLQAEWRRNATLNWRRSTAFGRWKRASSRPRDPASPGTCRGSALRLVGLSGLSAEGLVAGLVTIC